MTARFARDSDAAKEQLEQEDRQKAAHDRSMDQGTNRAKAKIVSPESYVKRPEAEILKSRDLAAKACERAQGIRKNARMMVRD